LISQDAIKNFNVDVVDNKGHKALYETDIPVDALPGDLFIVKVDDERTGTIKEVCEGLIISSDGEGHGVVLSDPKAGDDPGVMTVKVEIKPQFPMENISIQAKWVLP